MNRIFMCAGLTVTLVALSGCAPTIWDRPGTTQAEFNMDNARCRLVAEGANPAPDTDPIYTGNFKRDLAVNAGAGLAEGLVQRLAIRHTYDLCMEANGYVERASSGVQSQPPSSPPQTSAVLASQTRMPPQPPAAVPSPCDVVAQITGTCR
jgi:hypothetical protein